MSLLRTRKRTVRVRVGDEDVEVPIILKTYGVSKTSEIVQMGIDFYRLAEITPSRRKGRDERRKTSKGVRWACAPSLLGLFHGIMTTTGQIIINPTTAEERSRNKLLAHVSLFVEIGAAHPFRGGAVVQRIISGKVLSQYFDETTSDFYQLNPNQEAEEPRTDKEHQVVLGLLEQYRQLPARELAGTKALTPENVRQAAMAMLLGNYAARGTGWVNFWTDAKFMEFLDRFKATAATSRASRAKIISQYLENLRKKASTDENKKSILDEIQYLTELAFNHMYESVMSHILSSCDMRDCLDAISLQFNQRFHAMQDVTLTGMIPVLHPFWAVCMKSDVFLEIAQQSLTGDEIAKQRFLFVWLAMLNFYNALIDAEVNTQEKHKSAPSARDKKKKPAPLSVAKVKSESEMRRIIADAVRGSLTKEQLQLFFERSMDADLTLEKLGEKYGVEASTIKRWCDDTQKIIRAVFRKKGITQQDFIERTTSTVEQERLSGKADKEDGTINQAE